MEAYIVLSAVALPCLIAIIYLYTPKGKEWRRMNGLL